MVDNNDLGNYPTYFLKGAELIKQYEQKKGVCSENWCYPTEYRFGDPKDEYYGEIWTDGMDWNVNYWLLEKHTLEKPQAHFIALFDTYEEREKLHICELEFLFGMVMSYRRMFFLKFDSVIPFNYGDRVLDHLHIINDEPHKKYGNVKKVRFEHASQKPVEFWLNTQCLPVLTLAERYLYEHESSE